MFVHYIKHLKSNLPFDIHAGSNYNNCLKLWQGRKSDVWSFYEKREDKAKCLLRTKELVYSGGTSNLRDHLNCMHQNEYHPPKSD